MMSDIMTKEAVVTLDYFKMHLAMYNNKFYRRITDEDLLISVYRTYVYQLTDRQRQVYKMVKLDGMLGNQAAAELSVSPSTVCRALQAAQSKLTCVVDRYDRRREMLKGVW